MDKLTLLTYNCQGLRGKSKRAKVLNWINNTPFYILALQEAHYIESDTSDLAKDWRQAK